MTGILIREVRGIFETHIRGQGHMEAKAEMKRCSHSQRMSGAPSSGKRSGEILPEGPLQGP